MPVNFYLVLVFRIIYESEYFKKTRDFKTTQIIWLLELRLHYCVFLVIVVGYKPLLKF